MKNKYALTALGSGLLTAIFYAWVLMADNSSSTSGSDNLGLGIQDKAVSSGTQPKSVKKITVWILVLVVVGIVAFAVTKFLAIAPYL